MNDILLVDDDHIFLKLLKRLLESEGLSISYALNGSDALLLLQQQKFHLMVTDYEMPGIDGLELAQRVAAVAPNMAVIMLTGSILPELPHLAENVGIVKLLFKSFDPDELIEEIKRLGIIPK